MRKFSRRLSAHISLHVKQ